MDKRVKDEGEFFFNEIQKEKMVKMNKYCLDGISFEKLIKELNQMPLELATKEFKLKLNYDFEEDNFLCENYVINDVIKESLDYISETCSKSSMENIKLINKINAEDDKDMDHSNNQLIESSITPTIGYSDAQLSSSSPLDFINSIEKYTKIDPDFMLPSNKEYYPLKNNHEEGKIQIEIMQSNEKNIIRRKISKIDKIQFKEKAKENFKESFTTFCFNQNANTLFAGTTIGSLHRYEQDEIELGNALIGGDKVSITAIDCENNALALGYENGNLLFITDLIKYSNSVPISKYHQSAVSAIRILSYKPKHFKLISSEEDGKVIIIKGSKGMWSSNYTITKTEMCDSDIIHRIDVFNNPLEGNRKHERIYALGSPEEINIYKTKPNTTKILTHSKPSNADGEVPDFCFIQGLSPTRLMSSTPSSRAESSASIINPNQIYNFFCISWGKSIYLYVEKKNFQTGSIEKFSLRGKYSHTISIIRVTPLTDNFLLFVDKAMQVKIIATIDMKQIETGSTKAKPSLTNRKLEFLLNFSDFDLFKQMRKSTKHKLSFNLYKYSLIPLNKGLYVIGKKRIVLFKLIAWEQCLLNYIKTDDWYKTLMLCYEIFNKNMMFLGETIEEENRLISNKEDILKNVIMQITAKIKNKEIDRDLKTGYNMLIEFSIETSMQKLVLDWIYGNITTDTRSIKDTPEDDTSYYISQLFHCLEFYILSDQMIISSKIIEHMIQYYCSINKRSLLTQLLIHLDCDCLIKDSTSQLIKQHDLFRVYIYIIMNKEEDPKKQDYFAPIVFLFDLYSTRKEINNYSYFIRKKEEQLLNDIIQSSQQYIGHHILWYCNICFNGYIFPTDYHLIDKTNFEDLVTKISLWLTANGSLLMKFDCSSYFQVYTKIFIEPKLLRIMLSAQYNKYKPFIKSINFEIDNFHPLTLINRIYSECRKNNRFYAYKDFFDFILLIAVSNSKDIKLEFQLLIETIEFLLIYENKKNEMEEDIYNAHHLNMFNYTEENKKTESNILKLLSAIALTAEIIEKLIAACDMCLFSEVRCYLLKQTEHYSNCLAAHLIRCSDSEDQSDTKEVKSKELFSWILKTLEELSTKTKEFNRKAKEAENVIINQHIGIKSDISKQFKLLANKCKNNLRTKESSNTSIRKVQTRKEKVMQYLKLIENEPYEKIVEKIKKGTIKKQVHVLKDYYYRKEESKYEMLFTQFKSAILDNLEKLTEISFDKTFALTDTWFDEIQESMIQKLGHLPLLQIRFVNHYLKMKNEAKMNEEEDLEEYNNILRLKIKLLCITNRKNELLNIIKANRRICDNELLQLLEENDAFEASLFLLNTLGAFSEGIDLAIKAIDLTTIDILDNLLCEQFLRNKHTKLMTQTQSYFDLGIQICQCSSEACDKSCEDIWLNLINCLYANLDRLNKYDSQFGNNELTFYYIQAKKKFGEGIELILSRICEYVKMPVVIDIMTEKCKNVGMKEFKKLFTKTLSSFSRMTTVLNCARSLLNTTILLTRHKMFSVMGRGREYVFTSCDSCNSPFGNVDVVKTFYCGHKYHVTCTLKEGTRIHCPICLKKENEMIPGRIPKRYLVSVSLEKKIEENYKEDIGVRNEKLIQMKLKEKSNKLKDVCSIVSVICIM